MNQIIGVLWKKEKDGLDYYSGVLQDLRGQINIAVFPNNFKEADNQPDMNIVISWDKEKKEKETVNEPKKKTRKVIKKKEVNNDDLPF